VETSTHAPLNGHASQTYLLNLKGPNWVSVPGRRTLTPDVPVRLCALALVMELNPSDWGKGEVQLRESLQ